MTKEFLTCICPIIKVLFTQPSIQADLKNRSCNLEEDKKPFGTCDELKFGSIQREIQIKKIVESKLEDLQSQLSFRT